MFFEFKQRCEKIDTKLRQIALTLNVQSPQQAENNVDRQADLCVTKYEAYCFDDLVLDIVDPLYKNEELPVKEVCVYDKNNYTNVVQTEEVPINTESNSEDSDNDYKQKSNVTSKQKQQKIYPCTACNEQFHTYTEWINHRKSHGLLKYVCNICQRAFAKKAYLDKHQKTHKDITELQKFECECCSKRYTSKGNLERHMRCHTDDKRHVCDVCGKRFIQSTTLRSHQLTHLDIKNHACKDCDKKFKSKQYLLQHREKMHNKYFIQKPFCCNICSSKFISERKLKWHLSNHKSCDGIIPNKVIKKRQPRQICCICTFCGKTFKQRAQLRIHQRVHTGELPFECKLCHKKFRFQASFKFHEYSHTGERPFSCNLCPKTFRQPTHLRNHQKVHTGAKPHTCTYCPKSFASKSNLKVHIRIHTGERPYVCNDCGRAFLDSNGLKKHAKRHVE